MRRDAILTRLRELLPNLTASDHVRAIAVFGSVARDEASPDSDIDIIVEFDKSPGFFAFVDLQERLSRALGAKVDLFTKPGLHPSLRDRILREAIYA